MRSRTEVLDACQKALSLSPGDQTEVRLSGTTENLCRFARNTIHQSISRVDLSLSIRVIIAGASGVARTNQLDDSSIRRAVDRAADIARQGREDRGFVSLPGPGVGGSMGESYQGTMATHDQRASEVAGVIARAEKGGAYAHGFVASGLRVLAVANSLGLTAYHEAAPVRGVVVCERDGRSGYASGIARSLNDLRLLTMAQRAMQKWEMARDPVHVEPGDYEVILEPEALSSLITTLAMGFDARAVDQGRSFLSGRMGEEAASPLLSLRDDGHDPRGVPIPFDYEGVVKKPITLLDRGRPGELLVDSYTAGEKRLVPTGHTLSPDAPVSGAMPLNLFVSPGDSTLDDMIAGVSRGLLITRFWYHRVISPRQTLVTGLTRDGTFLIEHGKIRGAVHNLRYTDSVTRVLKGLVSLGRDLELKEFGPGAILLPAARLSGFRFTGSTTA